MKQMPTLSVLMPCSRIDSFIDDAITSILKQTYTDFELIIIANGLGSENEQLKKLEKSDSRIKVLSTDIKGLVFALNLGLSEASGKYIARMDSDDISLPTRFQRQLEWIEKNIDYDIVGCRVNLIDEGGELLDKKFPFYESNAEIIKILPVRNVLCHPALIFRKESLIRVGGYKYGFMSEDHELFLRMMYCGMKFHNINEVLFLYRRHNNQITAMDKAWKNFIEISAFLLMFAFRDKKYKCLLGVIATFPPVRKIYALCRKFMK